MHKKQLDGLRFFAFLLVFLGHIPGEPLGNYGGEGVHLFFVLSGFLITRILIQNQTGHLWHDLYVFYARRTLRIFPLYYAVLIFCIMAGRRDAMIAYFTYVYNIKVYLLGDWAGPAPHFWSLCVEEQFYFTFPFFILLLPRRYRIIWLPAMILLSGAAHYPIEAWFHDRPATALPTEFLLPVCGQYLLWGCLAGYLEVNTKRGKTAASWLFCAGAVLQVLVHFPMLFSWLSDWGQDILVSLSGMSFAWVVFGLWRAENPYLVKAFSFAPLAYLGKISYGLYVYHPFATENIAPQLLLPFFSPGDNLYTLLLGIIGFGLTVIISAISWHGYESPINDFKDRFPYGPKEGVRKQHVEAKTENARTGFIGSAGINRVIRMFVTLAVLAVAFQVALNEHWPHLRSTVRRTIVSWVKTMIPRF